MRLGVILPQLEIGTDPSDLRNYATAAEVAGYHHLHAYDHVLGANPDRPGWDGPYDYEDPFHEVLTLYSYLAAYTDRINLATGILILPQRQTALVAKQAAEIALLTDGRLRLGVGVGWNDVEYEAMGKDFSTRGARIEEQIDLLRQLWTEELVDFDGDFHRIPNAGLNPRPADEIPIWMGGGADPVLRRVGRTAQGWIVPGKWRQPDQPIDALAGIIDQIHGYATDHGRDPDDIAIIGRMTLAHHDHDDWRDRLNAWHDIGVTHLAIDTMDMGLTSPSEHIDTIETAHDVFTDSSIPVE